MPWEVILIVPQTRELYFKFEKVARDARRAKAKSKIGDQHGNALVAQAAALSQRLEAAGLDTVLPAPRMTAPADNGALPRGNSGSGRRVAVGRWPGVSPSP